MSVVDKYWNKREVPNIRQNLKGEWVLMLSLDDFSVEVVIRHDLSRKGTDAKINYVHHGERTRILSDGEYAKHVTAIIENSRDRQESDEAMEEFTSNTTCPELGTHEQAATLFIGNQLISKWENFVSLDIFSPSITI
jgi:hypothetical protein